ncbi:hypothetical protein BFF78_40540 [Streptomyces fodineus]|uniref:S-adenosyl methyltransferase n=1 Tax=Streptomyces fodineus TaxID=1904616 RepID=A0A1D7YLQ5_9ACTN|nr:SAM-dependent methyltransferase [Streptomyces fodineus]AOR36515.1 hypothetical protein BFF78_40540 [Streptomyces fodineus]
MTGPATTPEPAAHQNIDTSVPHSARTWNYWLGGKDNDPVDEEAGDAYTAVFPGIVTIARSSSGAVPYNLRTVKEITAFFDGLELVEPGVVPVTQWRPEPGSPTPEIIAAHGGLARKP